MRTKPILVSIVLGWLCLCASVFSQGSPVSSHEGLRLFHKMQEALGGADRIAAVRDFEQQVRAQSWNGNTGRSIGEVVKRTRWVRPTDLRVDQVGPGSTYVLYFNGTSGWEILPGSRAVVDLSGGELAFAQKYIRDFKLNTWLADRNASYGITSPSPNVVRIADGDIAHQLDITLDPVSSLPAKITSISLSDPAHPIPSDEVTTEWGTSRGLRFARRWTVYRSGVRVAEATVERTDVNTGLKQIDLAAKPADARPVHSSRQQPVVQVPLHSTGGASGPPARELHALGTRSRATSLRLVQIQAVFSLGAPCPPGASGRTRGSRAWDPSPVSVRRGTCTTGW